MREDNKGFTLIELIVVMAILSILATFFVVNMGYMTHSAAKACANAVKTAIGQTRIKTMGKEETYLYIYKDGNGYSSKLVNMKPGETNGTVESTDRLAKSKVTMSYTINKKGGISEGPNSIEGSDYLLIGFDRESGKLDTRGTNVNFDGGSKTLTLDDDDTTSLVINVMSGNDNYRIKIYAATGKVEL